MVYTSELICIFQLHSRQDGKRENFAEKGVASRQVVRERWSRVLKVRLLEGEQECYFKLFKPAVFKFGRKDCVPDQAKKVATYICST